MRYMLDTDICIYVINQRPAAAIANFRRHEEAGIGISAVTAGELFWGVAKTRSQRNLDTLRRFLAPLEIAPFDEAASEVFGQLKAWLHAQGEPIGPYDTQIAAHAHALGAILVTNNVREYQRVPGLRLENWAV